MKRVALIGPFDEELTLEVDEHPKLRSLLSWNFLFVILCDGERKLDVEEQVHRSTSCACRRYMNRDI